MANISVNLLPPEFIAEDLKKAKFYKIQIIGVAVILGMCFLTSLTVALRILQGNNIRQVQAKVEDSQQRISDLKNTQASLVLLKDRLAAVGSYLGVSSKQTSIYQLLDKLIPADVSINAITIDKSSEVIVVATVADSQSLDDLVENLNDDRISQVSIDNLNRGRDGVYRISFKIKPKD